MGKYVIEVNKDTSISDIARIIQYDWNPISPYALDYVVAMLQIEKITDRLDADKGGMIVAYFLSNSSQWRGDIARLVKTELKRRLKEIEA